MGIRNMIHGLRAHVGHRVQVFWPQHAEFSIWKSLACITLGIGTSVLVFGRATICKLYLWSAFSDPLFQSKFAFGITFSFAILAVSFSVGYFVLEVLLWTRSKARRLRRWSVRRIR